MLSIVCRRGQLESDADFIDAGRRLSINSVFF